MAQHLIIAAAYNDWLEERLAGLLRDGVRRDDIAVERHPDGVTLVTVKGEPKYRFQFDFTGNRLEPGDRF